MKLKIAVSAGNDGLDAQIDPRFGRCRCFVIVDSATMGIDVIPNTSQSAASGAGIHAAQTIVNRGVKLVITGRVGPNAQQVLAAAGIEIITGVYGTVRNAVEAFRSGQLRDTTTAPTTPRGVSRAAGAGMGLGRGRGMGFRRWQTTGPYVTPPTSPPLPQPTFTVASKKLEIQALKRQTDTLQQQIDQIKQRLENLRESRAI